MRVVMIRFGLTLPLVLSPPLRISLSCGLAAMSLLYITNVWRDYLTDGYDGLVRKYAQPMSGSVPQRLCRVVRSHLYRTEVNLAT
ncbi:hypothetical protein OBBRIDRAFT_796951 [Obba rivulosa]|uniref:Uncharacterized protein n=1 Tax=Obba rivulosa TaxID=1052685 RepID=A0A8E2AM08_9APHY|nr:hypothetical protein OBBRIDRAFT_796951 [Obba rivulosa]